MLSWKQTLRLVPLVIVTSLVAALLVAGGVSAAEHASGDPAEVETQDVPSVDSEDLQKPRALTQQGSEPHGAELDSGYVVAELPETNMDSFSMLGVTWDSGLSQGAGNTLVEVRWRFSGKWSEWTELHLDPQPGVNGRAGTEPMWVDQADGAQVRILSSQQTHPDDVQLVTVNPGSSPGFDSAAANRSQPEIVDRGMWGARPKEHCSSPVRAKLKGAIVHHTADSNSYSRTDSPGIVQSTQAYHMQGRGWCDIGYNFLVDKYGQVFEGRAGGVTKSGKIIKQNVRGAHAGDFQVNTNTMGVSLIGSFGKSKPTKAMRKSLVQLISWRFQQNKLLAKGKITVGGISLQRISGHRDVVDTACPGKQVYDWLSANGGLRDRVRDVLESSIFENEIAWLVDNGISSRFGDGTFRPRTNVSREAVAAFLYRYAGKPKYTPPAKSPFSDVDVKAKFYKEITWLVSTGVTDGYSNGTFRPRAKVSREAIAAFLYRFAGGPKADISKLDTFNDVDGEAKFAKPIAWLLDKGITTGYGDDTFRPRANVSREATAAFLYRFNQLPRDFPAPPVVKFANSKFSKQIGWLVDQEITKRYADGTFRPGTRVSREAMAAFLYRYAGQPNADTSKLKKFRDVGVEDKFAKPIAWLVDKGITTGYKDGTFRPRAKISREAMSAFLYRYAGKPKYTPPTSSPFCDVATKSEFYKSITWLTATGITDGYKDATFRPWSKISREATAAFLYRYDKNDLTSTKSLEGKAARCAGSGGKVDSVSVPKSGSVTLKGHGYGHGVGMSQYGAQGAALKGKTYKQILQKYYPGTSISKSSKKSMRVWITGDTNNNVTVEARTGLRWRKYVNGKWRVHKLPTKVGGKKVVRWRLKPEAGGTGKSVLQSRTGGKWRRYGKVAAWSGWAQFKANGPLELRLPNNSTRKYRGELRLDPHGTWRTINVLALDPYTKGVVAREMPASWERAAIRSQTIAARTYGVHEMGGGYYDICDTTACQVYGGVAAEHARTNKAVDDTARKILTYGSKPAFTQFSSSSGGYTKKGSEPYLKAVKDPWDNWSGNPNRTWSAKVTVKKIKTKCPGKGRPKKLTVTSRNGYGDMGGRVNNLRLTCSNGTVNLSGSEARFAFGLKSDWFGFK